MADSSRPTDTSATKARMPRIPVHDDLKMRRPMPKTAEEARDPDGIAPAHEAAKDEPKALPNSDRHEMETAVAKPRTTPDR